MRGLALLVLGAIVNIAIAWGCASRSSAPRWGATLMLQNGFDLGGYGEAAFVISAGVPSHAVRGVRCWGYLGAKTETMWHVPIAWTPDGRGLWLPLRPIWPGFAINTVFYAAILWGVLAALLAMRKRRRIKGGLCPICAYDLRGAGSADAAVCPECGAVRNSAFAPT